MLGLEGLDLRLDARLALCERALGSHVLFALRCPVGSLLGGLEGRVLTNRGVRVGEDLLDILRANTVREVGRELLLEADDLSQYRHVALRTKSLTARHPPPQGIPCIPRRDHRKCTSSGPHHRAPWTRDRSQGSASRYGG